MSNKYLIGLFSILISLKAVVAQEPIQPFCLTCKEKNLVADVYIVALDDIQGQLISGQFYRIAGVKEKADMSLGDVDALLKSRAKEYIKIGGNAYCLLSKDSKFQLCEIIRTDEHNILSLKISPLDKKITDKEAFLNIIIPRKDKAL